MNRPVIERGGRRFAPNAPVGGAPHGKLMGGSAPVYAALDLGTNGTRLLIAAPGAGGFQVIEGVTRITRLGEGLLATGRLSENAVQRTLAALSYFMERIERRGVNRIRAVATEACRRAGNGREVLARMSAMTGVTFELIPAEEEASLTLSGCLPLFDPAFPAALVFDIGGGSTELILVRRGSLVPERVASLPFGVVTLAERMGVDDPAPTQIAALVAEIAALLRAFDHDGEIAGLARAGQLSLIGTTGTVTTMAAVHLGLLRYDRRAIDGVKLSFGALEAASRHLLAIGSAGRHAMACIGPQRADLVVAGCAVLEAICLTWPAGEVVVADRGLRDGLVLAMIRADAAARALQP